MSLKKIIEKIASHKEIVERPLVLLDVGASIEMHPFWKPIAHFAVCIAFEADDRDFNYVEDEKSDYKKLIKVTKIVVSQKQADTGPFYLTRSPYCSSTLEPDSESLKDHHFAPLFDVTEKIDIGVVALPEVLREMGINYIDWFKTDSQGTDLRLFRSLDENIQDRAIVVEMEPGFIDAYKGEDKLVTCLDYMAGKKQFFLTLFNVKGPLRMPAPAFEDLFKSKLKKKLAARFYKTVPGWAEIIFMNDLKQTGTGFNLREYLVAWLFATLQGQHDVAYVYALNAQKHFPQENLSTELLGYSQKSLRRALYSRPVIYAMLNLALKKVFG